MIVDINHDPLTGVTDTTSIEGGKLVTRSVQDVSANLDYTAKLRASPEYARQGIREDMQHVAHVPAVVVLKWINEHGFDATTAHPREILRFIERNPEYHYLKTTTGAIVR